MASSVYETRTPSSSSSASGGSARGSGHTGTSPFDERFARFQFKVDTEKYPGGFKSDPTTPYQSVKLQVPDEEVESLKLVAASSTTPVVADTRVLHQKIAELQAREITSQAEKARLVEENSRLQLEKERLVHEVSLHYAARENVEKKLAEAVLLVKEKDDELTRLDSLARGLMEHKDRIEAANQKLETQIAKLKSEPAPVDNSAELLDKSRRVQALESVLHEKDAELAEKDAIIAKLKQENPGFFVGVYDDPNSVSGVFLRPSDLLSRSSGPGKIVTGRKPSSSSTSGASCDPAILTSASSSEKSFDPDGSDEVKREIPPGVDAVIPAVVVSPVISEEISAVKPEACKEFVSSPAMDKVVVVIPKVDVDDDLVDAVMKNLRNDHGSNTFVLNVLDEENAKELIRGILEDIIVIEWCDHKRGDDRDALIEELSADIRMMKCSIPYKGNDFERFKKDGYRGSVFSYVPPGAPKDLVPIFAGTKLDAEQYKSHFHFAMIRNYVTWGTETSMKVAEIVKPKGWGAYLSFGWRG
jgi:hypothetical protein